MLSIDKHNNITLTRGDSMTLTVKLLKRSSSSPSTLEPYIPEPGETLRFAVSKKFKGNSGYELKISKDIPIDTLTFTCTPEETDIDYRTYNYDIEITHLDGSVDTFISGKLTITGEVK